MLGFYEEGNSEITGQMDAVQLAVIKAVDTDSMTADIEWLGTKGGRSRVTLAMPMAGPGYGVYCIPKRGTMCAVGMRNWQVPLILAYLPANAFSPLSFFDQMREEFGLADSLHEGDVLLRSLSDVAKCDECGTVSPLAAWSANLDPATLREKCPECGAPASVVDQSTGTVLKVNKIQFGATFHMRSDGRVEFQLNNRAMPGEDADRLLKIIVTPDSNISIVHANDLDLGADGNITMRCQDFTVDARGAVSERSTSRNSQVATDNIEAHTSKTIKAENLLGLEADTISSKAATLISQEAGVRRSKVTEDDLEEVGRKTVKSADTITIEAAADIKVRSTGANINFNAVKIVMQDGTLKVARDTDPTLADSSTDAAFFTFLTNLVSTINLFFTVTYNLHTHVSAAPGVPTGPPVPLQVASAPAAPSQLDGKINGGEPTILAGS